MKICMVMGGNEEGGLENHVVEISNAIANIHEVHVIAHPKYVDRFKGVFFHPVDLTRSRRNAILLYSVASIIRTINPDIIHAQANKAVAIVATLRLFLPSRIKIIATLHSLKRKLKSYEKYDWVIGVSARALKHLENTRKSVVYNGVEFDKKRVRSRGYLSKQLELTEDKILFVAMGRLVAVKRFDRLINAFQGIKNAYLIIVGEGSERKSLEQQIKKNGQNNICLLGHRTDNIEILSAADICVISSDREGFSYVMAESLLVKTPVISTDVADMKKILPFQAVVNNEIELSSLIVNIVNNLDTFKKDFQASYKWAQDNLSIEKMSDETIQIYRKVLSE